MKSTIQLVVLLFAIATFSGCTIHFKGKDIEMDVERQRVYKMESISLFENVVQKFHPEKTRLAKYQP